MKVLLATSAFLAVSSLTLTARAQSGLQPGEAIVEPLPTGAAPADRDVPSAPTGEHPVPWLKLSYVRFSAGNVDGNPMPLEALRLDMYALSLGWLRGGLDLEAGRGHAALLGATASVKYGLVGANMGLQIPGRVTPFIEGQVAAGVLGGSLDDPLMVPGTSVTVTGVSAATWMVTRGVDAGAEIYVLGRAYLSLGVGWLRTTWGSVSTEAMGSNQSGGGVQFTSVSHDSVLFKGGIGI